MLHKVVQNDPTKLKNNDSNHESPYLNKLQNSKNESFNLSLNPSITYHTSELIVSCTLKTLPYNSTLFS